MGIYDVDTRAITRRLREDGSLIGVLSTEQQTHLGHCCNGPGDPSAVPNAVETVKEIIGKVPVFGICMGQALGGKTFKMKFGHHGGNHPVRNLRNGSVEISAQNHNYAVDPESLPEGVEVTHVNLNDGSCVGFAFPGQKLMSLQYHPEASHGPHDSDLVFAEFIQLMKHNRG